MNSKEIVNEVMKMRGMSRTALANKLGYVAPSGITQRLQGKQDMRVDTLIKFLEAMDCEVVIRSKLSDKSKWTVTAEEE